MPPALGILSHPIQPSSCSSIKKMLMLLEEYITALRESEARLDDS